MIMLPPTNCCAPLILYVAGDRDLGRLDLPSALLYDSLLVLGRAVAAMNLSRAWADTVSCTREQVSLLGEKCRY